jgi:hypothetical protein
LRTLYWMAGWNFKYNPLTPCFVTMRIATSSLLLACVLAVPARAQAFWVGGDMGAGSVDMGAISPSGSQTRLALNFALGVAVIPGVDLGVRLGGWNLQASDQSPNGDPTRGQTLTTLSLMARLGTREASGWYVQAGWGPLKLASNQTAGQQGSGYGGFAGAGYDFDLGHSVQLGPYVEYYVGSLDVSGGNLPAVSGSVRCATASVAVRYRFPE